MFFVKKIQLTHKKRFTDLGMLNMVKFIYGGLVIRFESIFSIAPGA